MKTNIKKPGAKQKESFDKEIGNHGIDLSQISNMMCMAGKWCFQNIENAEQE